MNLAQVLQRSDLWRAATTPPPVLAVPTGFPSLDQLLPSGGWPVGALTEIAVARAGIGELQLLLPALAQLSRGERFLALVAPPYLPYAPAWARALNLARVLVINAASDADTCWSVEQSLRSGACAAVLTWHVWNDAKPLRRLQRAAEVGGSWAVWFHGDRRIAHSPAALQLRLESGPATATGRTLNVHIVKRRGGWATGPLALKVDHALVMPTSAESPARDLDARYTHP